MAEDPLDDIIASVRTRLQTELERQLLEVSDGHQQALAAARRQIEADAEQRWTARFEAAQADLDTARAELASAKSEVEAAKADSDEKVLAAATAARAEMERHAADETARVREMEQALQSERQLSQSRLDAERRAVEQLEQARMAFDTERGQWTSSLAAAQTPATSSHAGSLLRSLRDIDNATSVSDSLAAIARAAAAEAPRAAIFIANGGQLDEWAVSGLPPVSAGSLNLDDPAAGIAVEALTTRQIVRNNGSACAVPLILDGTPIAVLYAEAEPGTGEGAGWGHSLEAVARHGAARLGYLTALRTAQARQWLAAATTAGPSSGRDDAATAVASARRYARLVVSEVKLYNEAAVQSGRADRDLLERLGSEIDRARRLYEDRVPASVPGRADFFQQELVQTLAGGDPSLLG